MVQFSVKDVWEELKGVNPFQSWTRLVWFNSNIPNHSFILWLAIQGRLKTQDRLKSWEFKDEMSCSFCNSQLDSSGYLFFECDFSNKVRKQVTNHAGFGDLSSVWYELIEDLITKLKRKNIENDIGKLILAATIYHIWKERNARLFRRSFHEVEEVVWVIIEDVRFKLLSLKQLHHKMKKETRMRWSIPWIDNQSENKPNNG